MINKIAETNAASVTPKTPKPFITRHSLCSTIPWWNFKPLFKVTWPLNGCNGNEVFYVGTIFVDQTNHMFPNEQSLCSTPNQSTNELVKSVLEQIQYLPEEYSTKSSIISKLLNKDKVLFGCE